MYAFYRIFHINFILASSQLFYKEGRAAIITDVFMDKEMKPEDSSVTCPMSVSNLVVKAELEFLAPDCDTGCVSLYNAALEHHKMWLI